MTDLLKIANAVVASMKSGSYQMTDAAQMNGNVATAAIRDFGQWVVPADEEDDGDYDWCVPTDKTFADASRIIARHEVPGVKITLNIGEKNWLYVNVAKA